MKARGELVYCSDLEQIDDAEGASESESLRQTDSCSTQLWRVFSDYD